MLLTEYYQYPDTNDTVTINMIRDNEPFKGYWQESERFALERVITLFSNSIECNHKRRFLDAGCGEGRLLPLFIDSFNEIVAIDPDHDRLEKARLSTKANPELSKIFFYEKSIEDFNDNNQFDCILCSHIIQHISTKSIHNIFSKFSKFLRPGGYLAITTTHSTKDTDYFVKEYYNNGSTKSDCISNDVFNSLAKNNLGILPIHFFHRNSLVSDISKYGFSLIDDYVFHVFGNFGETENFIHRDRLVNAIPELKDRFGRDIYLGFKRN